MAEDVVGMWQGGAHQVLDSLTSGSTRPEPRPQALLGNPRHGMMTAPGAVTAMPRTVAAI
jgi:hypothetical protein